MEYAPLAVGHVDDAHQSEGDGQAERGEQEDAGEADAVERVAEIFGARDAAVDGAQRDRGGATDLRIGLGVVALCIGQGERGEQGTHRRPRTFGETFGGRAAQRRVGALEFERRGRQDERLPGLGVGLFRERSLQQWQLRGVRGLLERLRCRPPLGDVGRQQLQSGVRGVECATQTIVDDDIVGAFGQGELLVGDRIDRVAVGIDHEHAALGGHVDRFVTQRLQQRDRFGRRDSPELRDGRDLLIGVVAAERLDEVGVERRHRRHRDHRQRDAQCEAPEADDPSRGRGRFHGVRSIVTGGICPSFETSRASCVRSAAGVVPALRLAEQLCLTTGSNRDHFLSASGATAVSPSDTSGSSFFFSLPATYGLHGCALIGSLVFQTTLN